ncbi:MAG: hypothetical protein GX098_06500 [Bacteroidales bacterium]|nr:hypothetical protein [Bacteroidales bacterium]
MRTHNLCSSSIVLFILMILLTHAPALAQSAGTLTWNGSRSSSWDYKWNWTPNAIPTANHAVVIPDKATTTFYPIIPASAICYSISISSGGRLHAQSRGKLVLAGTGIIWSSDENSTINLVDSEIVFGVDGNEQVCAISGYPTFFNLTVGSSTNCAIKSNSHIKIQGDFILKSSSIFNASSETNTIEFIGYGQSIPTPNGGSSGYYSLRISGSGAMFPLGVTRCVNLEVGLEGDVIVPAGTGLTVTGS